MYASIAAAIEGTSALSAPTIGGIVVEKLSWRWCFALPGLLSVFTLLVTIIFLKDLQVPERTTWKQKLRQLDLVGNLVFLPSLTCLFTALSWGGTKWSWDSPTIIALFCVFAALLIVFAVDQWVKG